MRHAIHLHGCAPTPLAHYLKALGVLRLVGEQVDPAATGQWEEEHFVLHGDFDRAALVAFFLHDYRPSPVVAPWNGGSGFYPKDNKNGIDTIAAANAPRFRRYRHVIEQVRQMLSSLGLTASPNKGSQKNEVLLRLRATLPDEALSWFDAAILLVGDEPRYPPLLGTGGNDGRLDFTNNFMQRLAELFDPADGQPRAEAGPWLGGALFGTPTTGLVDKAVGQFFPGGAGGPNATTGFDAGSRLNPWDFVLTMEGALLFAAAASRRLESVEPEALSYPFTVRATGSGFGAACLADEGSSRAEIWMPLWRGRAGLAEVQALFAEGRATVGRRPARDGLDFARAVAGLGVARGIDRFERFAFLMRSGKAYLATPVGRVAVRRVPDSDLVEDLERRGYLDRVRRFARGKEAPGRIRQVVRRLEDELLRLVQAGGRQSVQRVLAVLGVLEQTVGESPAAQEAVPPIPELPERWVLRSDDGSAEFRLAAALAGIACPGLPMRAHLAPVTPESEQWAPGSHLAVWGDASLVVNLIRVAQRRLLVVRNLALADKPFGGHPPADLGAVIAFLKGHTDDQRIGALLSGLALARMPRRLDRPKDGVSVPGLTPAAFAVLKLLFTDDGLLRFLGLLPEDRRLTFPPELLSLLTAGRVERAVALAWARCRVAGLEIPAVPRHPPAACGVDPVRLAAALLVPLGPGDLGTMADRLLHAERSPAVS